MEESTTSMHGTKDALAGYWTITPGGGTWLLWGKAEGEEEGGERGGGGGGGRRTRGKGGGVQEGSGRW